MTLSVIILRLRRSAAVLLTVALLGGALVTGALAEGPAAPAQLRFPALPGDVSFNHQAHQRRVPACTTCHHNGVEAGRCHDCHLGQPGVPRARDAFHKLCKGCHTAKRGPTLCGGCHAIPAQPVVPAPERKTTQEKRS